jgi:hypothetical protein
VLILVIFKATDDIMKTISSLICMLLLIGLTARLAGWNDGWHLWYGVPAAIVFCGALFLVRSWWLNGNRIDDFADSHDESLNEFRPVAAIFQGVVQGCCIGLLLCIFLGGSFAVLKRIPYCYERYYDQDRLQLESQLSALAAAGNHAQAAAQIESRLTHKLSATYQQALVQRLYQNLVDAGKQAPEVNEALIYYHRAQAVAKNHRLDDTLAAALLASSRELQRRDRRLEELRQRGDWAALIAALDGLAAEQPDSLEISRRLYQVLWEASQLAADGDARTNALKRAAEFERQLRIEPGPALAALSQSTATTVAQEKAEAQHAVALEQLKHSATEVRQQILAAWLHSANQLPDPSQRLDVLSKLKKTAGQQGLALADLDTQIQNMQQVVANQQTLHRRIQALRQAQDWEQLVPLLTRTLQSADSQVAASYREWLAESLSAWCSAAQQSGTKIRSERLTQSRDFAIQFQIDARPFEESLAALEDERARGERIEAMITGLRKDRKYRQLAFYLQFQIDDKSRPAWQQRFDQLLYQASLDAARAEQNLNDQLGWYLQACEVATRFQLADSEARQELQNCRKAIERQEQIARDLTQPRLLPAGARGVVARLFPEIRAVEVCISTPQGSPIQDLKSKDFRVALDGADQEFLVFPVEVECRRQVVLIADVSGSTAAVLPTVKSAVANLIDQLALCKTEIKVLPFSDTVQDQYPWTTVAAEAKAVIQSQQARGGTALYKAVASGCRSLDAHRTPASERQMIVFTDGKDSAAGVTLDEVITQCKSHEIACTVVALRTENLEINALKRLTAETGGQLLEASDVEQLASQLLVTAQAFQKHRYRIIVANASQHAQELTVRVGQGTELLLRQTIKGN